MGRAPGSTWQSSGHPVVSSGWPAPIPGISVVASWGLNQLFGAWTGCWGAPGILCPGWRYTGGWPGGAVVGVSSLCSTCCYSLGVGWGLWAKRLIGCATHVATAWGEVRAPSRRGFDLCVTPVNAAWGVVKAPWVFWFNCCVVPVATA